MPQGKGTYGSKVGRPKKKKMMGGGSSKAAKPMAKSVYKKGGAKKKLPKAQPGRFMKGLAAGAIGTGGGSAYDSALKALGLGKGAAGAVGKGIKSAAGKLGKAALTAKEAQRIKDFGISGPTPPAPPILSAPTIPVTNIEEASDAAGKDVSGTIVDNFGKGGSVINGKSLRSTRSYKR